MPSRPKSSIIKYAATFNDLNLIDSIRRSVYEEPNLVPLEVYSIVIKHQNSSTLIFKDLNTGVAGYFTIILLQNKTMEQLIRQEISEKDLSFNNFIPLINAETDLSGFNIYILSVASNKPSDHNFNLFLLQNLAMRLKFLISEFGITQLYAQFVNSRLSQFAFKKFGIKNLH